VLIRVSANGKALGSTVYAVGPGATARATLKLTKRSRRLIRRRGRITARVMIAVLRGDLVVTRTVTVTLRAKKR